MFAGKRFRVLAALMLVATAAGVMVAVTASGAAPNEVRLHLGTDSRSFKYGNTTQNLTTAPNTCTINSTEPVMDLGSTGYKTAPGLASNSIGVYSSKGGNGTPCSQIDPTEALQLTPGSGLTGRTFSGVRLDLEMTGNAVAKLTFSNGSQSATYLLQTGTSIAAAQRTEPGYDTTVPYTASSSPGDTTDACAAANSSGPNSGPNDNCEWTVQPGFNFTTVTLTAASCGTVSLEGSSDFGNDPNYDSLFFLSNSAPVANDDTVTTPEDTAVSRNVLTNDTDADGNPLSASLLTTPHHGTLNFDALGAYTYTPDANFNGPDSFTYSASDGIASSNATVRITVTPVNDAPVAVSGNSSTDEDQKVTITIATDIDSTSLTADCTGAAGGTVHDNGDGTIDFTPAANFNGNVTLTCTATDDQGAQATSSATIVVGVGAVNDPPVANDDTVEVPQNATTNVVVLGNDTDIDSPTLTPTSIGNLSPSGATASANPDGTIAFTPPAGYDGPASFTYKANDGQASSNPATVSLTVYPVICSNETVTDTDGDVIGAFTRLDDSFNCKRYALDASAANGAILFQPSGAAAVDYRGYVSFGGTTAPVGPFPLLLEYDPTGGNTFQPVQWCINPQFDGSDNVTTATLPGVETWCIASADTRPNASGDLVTTWQVFGHDDPRFR